MAEKTIKHASFWYVTSGGINKTALRGDTVDIERDEDLERGERHGAFASKEDLAPGAPLAADIAAREAASPVASVTVDPAEVESRTSPAGSADPRIQSGMVDPTTVPSPTGTNPAPAPTPDDGETVIGESRPSTNEPKSAWVDYYVEQRPDDVDEATARAEAEAMTKAQLVERAGRQYGTSTPPPS